MNQEQTQQTQQTEAIKILIESVRVAQSKGCYSLDEAALIHKACSTFLVKNDGEQTPSVDKK